MKRLHTSDEIKKFIISNVIDNPSSISKITSDYFRLSRQSINRHLSNLISEGILRAEGKTRNRRYYLKSNAIEYVLNITPQLDEDQVWRSKILPHLSGLNSNIVDICHYGFTEMLNNVVDHSEGKRAIIKITRYPNNVELCVLDKGVGIFKKIVRDLQLEDERHALLELSKGKLTTDKQRHTGEGIFFSSRMFDTFSILSGTLFFTHKQGVESDWLLQDEDMPTQGTIVKMSIDIDSTRTLKGVFDQYTSSDGDYGFTRTHLLVDLVRYGQEQLVSRSQAKRLLSRLDPFKEIVLDFSGIDFIGQAFADEIFRVFKKEHPSVILTFVDANTDIERIIERVSQSSTDDSQLKFKL